MSEETVVLGVTGSIAAYKALDVASSLVQRGVTVRVVMTESATRFVTALSFESITHHPVLIDLWAEQPDLNVSHIRLAQAASVVAIVPATANIIAKAALGLGDDALSSLLLAVRAPIVVAPAMNTAMWTNPATRHNVETLRRLGATFVGPASGYLAEGSSGEGRLAEPSDIVAAITALITRTSDLDGQRIVVTAGPTREPIDPVRYISNRSSGKMGYAIAEAAARRGASVTLVSGPVSLQPPDGVETIPVTTAEELLLAVQAHVAPGCTLVMAAAVADYRPSYAFSSKLKRGHDDISLPLTPAVDVLASLQRPPGMRVVAFAAETNDLLEQATAKLLAKKADMLVANDVSEVGAGFDSDTNHVWLCLPGKEPEEVPVAPKRQVAEVILDRILNQLEPVQQ